MLEFTEFCDHGYWTDIASSNVLALYPMALRSDTICSARALPTWSVVPLTTTFIPAVPDAFTSALALARLGPDHVVVLDPAVYGQYDTYDG